MIKPFDFQQGIILDTKAAILNRHKKIIIQSPTGSGKTVIFSNIISSADGKGTKCLVLTDRMELLTGSDDTLENFDLDTTRIIRGVKNPPKEYTHVLAMSQTLRRRINKPEWLRFIRSFGIVIIDEAHVQEFNVYFEKNVFTSNQYVLAFTATPKRLKKQRQLEADYSLLIEGPQIPYLVSRGFLVPDKYYAPNAFDVAKLHVNSFGEYKDDEMFKSITTVVPYHNVVKNWKKVANDTITIVFCVNIEHTVRTCDAFNKAGIPAKFIVSNMSRPKYPKDDSDANFVKYKERMAAYEVYKDGMVKYSGDRDTVINEWKQGKFKILVNSGILTKGFDHRPTETVVVYRATTSETLWLQMIGRGSRTYPGKTHFNILDFGSNAQRLGMYNQERMWTLNGTYGNAEGVAPTKECGIVASKLKPDKNGKIGCEALVLASRKICPYCGYVFEKEKVEVEVDLVQIEYTDTAYVYKTLDFMRLERTAEERGYKFGWIINQVIAYGGSDALDAFRKYKDYNKSWTDRMAKYYSRALGNYEKMQNKPLQKQSQSRQLLF